MVYIGFLIFLSGFIISTISVPEFDQIGRALIPISLAPQLRGSIIQFLGGLVSVTGLLICISSYPKSTPPMVIMQKPVEQPTQKITPEYTGNVEPQTLTPKCKFCGNLLREGDVFCPSCQRSQT